MRVHKYQASDEKAVLTALITNDRVLGRLAPVFQKEKKPFRSRWANIIANWCSKYFQEYDKSPGNSIAALFRNWAEKNEEDDAVPLVEKYLTELSDEHTENINEDHILDVASRHFDTVRLERLNETLENELTKKDIEAAKLAVAEFAPTAIATTDIVDVMTDKDAWKDAVEHQEADELIKYPGALGEFFQGQLVRDGFISFLAPEKRGKCLEGSTLVQLANGELRTIADLVKSKHKGDIITINGSKFVRAPIAQHWDNGEKECLSITTKSGRNLVCTLNHPLFTQCGWQEAGNLRTGDFVAAPKCSPFFGRFHMLEEEVCFVAYMLADGCTVSVYDKGASAGHACSFIKEDPDIIRRFKSCCSKLGVHVLQRGIQFGLSGNGRRLMRKHGIAGHGSKTKQIPSCIMRLPKSLMASFLRTFFTCDGSIYLERGKRHVEITLANEPMLRQIAHMLMRFGIVGKFSYSPKKCNGKSFDAWRISIQSDEYVNLFLKEINFDAPKHTEPNAIEPGRSFLDRLPYEVVRNLWGEIKARGKGELAKVFGHRIKEMIREQLRLRQPMMRKTFRNVTDRRVLSVLDAPILWDEIVEIKSIGKRHTYDLGVDVTHNFVAGDVVVHNSFWLIDMAWRSAIMEKRRTLLYSVGDMSQRQMMRRIVARATKRPLRAGKFECPRKLRRTSGSEIIVDSEQYSFDESISMAEVNDAIEKNHLKTASKKSILKMRCTSAGSTTVKDIRNDIEELVRNGWVPDVLIIDYADILAPEPGSGDEYRHQINETWKALRRLSQDFHLLLVTATQADAASYGKGLIRRENFSEDKRKLSHVTGCLGINQTEPEKEKGLFRLNWVLLREGTYYESKCVTVASCLAIANPCVTSIW